MKASDFSHSMAVLIARYGDLDVYCDSDGVIAPAGDIQALQGLREGDGRVFVVCPGPRMPLSDDDTLHFGPP